MLMPWPRWVGTGPRAAEARTRARMISALKTTADRPLFSTLVLTVLTGLVYPLIVTGVAQFHSALGGRTVA